MLHITELFNSDSSVSSKNWWTLHWLNVGALRLFVCVKPSILHLTRLQSLPLRRGRHKPQLDAGSRLVHSCWFWRSSSIGHSAFHP